jgi:hypothetical protein
MTRVRACTMRCRCHNSWENRDLRQAIRLLLPPPLRADLSRVADPQLKLQLGYETFEPACVPAGLHADAHCFVPTRETTVILLRLVGMCQPFLLDLSRRGVEQSDLLKLGMEIYSYNDHRSALLSPEPVGWFRHRQLYSGYRSRHCHGINYAHLPIPDKCRRSDGKKSKFEC